GVAGAARARRRGLGRRHDRALARAPADRFPTMAAMRDELRAVMRGLSSDGRVGPAEASAPPVVPRHARSAWVLSGSLGRVFGRRRSGGAPPTPPLASAPGSPPRPPALPPA